MKKFENRSRGRDDGTSLMTVCLPSPPVPPLLPFLFCQNTVINLSKIEYEFQERQQSSLLTVGRGFECFVRTLMGVSCFFLDRGSVDWQRPMNLDYVQQREEERRLCSQPQVAWLREISRCHARPWLALKNAVAAS